jgi:hypothetical protein
VKVNDTSSGTPGGKVIVSGLEDVTLMSDPAGVKLKMTSVVMLFGVMFLAQYV